MFPHISAEYTEALTRKSSTQEAESASPIGTPRGMVTSGVTRSITRAYRFDLREALRRVVQMLHRRNG